MAQKSKIVRYGLEARCAAMAFGEKPATVEEIAAALTEELKGADTISKSAVAAYLKPLRSQVREDTRDRITQHIKDQLDSDLECVEEVQLFLMNVMRDKNRKPALRVDAGVKAVKVIDVKLARALGEAPTGEDSFDPVDLSKYQAETPEEPDDGISVH